VASGIKATTDAEHAASHDIAMHWSDWLTNHTPVNGAFYASVLAIIPEAANILYWLSYAWKHCHSLGRVLIAFYSRYLNAMMMMMKMKMKMKISPLPL
jgi:hypothetical protein